MPSTISLLGAYTLNSDSTILGEAQAKFVAQFEAEFRDETVHRETVAAGDDEGGPQQPTCF